MFLIRNMWKNDRQPLDLEVPCFKRNLYLFDKELTWWFSLRSCWSNPHSLVTSCTWYAASTQNTRGANWVHDPFAATFFIGFFNNPVIRIIQNQSQWKKNNPKSTVVLDDYPLIDRFFNNPLLDPNHFTSLGLTCSVCRRSCSCNACRVAFSSASVPGIGKGETHQKWGWKTWFSPS